MELTRELIIKQEAEKAVENISIQKNSTAGIQEYTTKPFFDLLGDNSSEAEEIYDAVVDRNIEKQNTDALYERINERFLQNHLQPLTDEEKKFAEDQLPFKINPGDFQNPFGALEEYFKFVVDHGEVEKYFNDISDLISKFGERLNESTAGDDPFIPNDPFVVVFEELENDIQKLINHGRIVFEELSRIPDIVNERYNQARVYRVPVRRDPLTLDLDGDGLETTPFNAANPVFFDHDLNGIKECTGWIGADDGFLVYDRNGNNVIDNGSELFGDQNQMNLTPLIP